MPEFVAGKSRCADRVPVLVKNGTGIEIGDTARLGQGSTKAAEIAHAPVAPKEWVDCWHTCRVVSNGVCVGQTVYESRVIDDRGECVIAAQGPQVLKTVSL